MAGILPTLQYYFSRLKIDCRGIEIFASSRSELSIAQCPLSLRYYE